jgi:hypothetical protein
VVSPIFVIPKRESGKWRVIVDLRYVNRYQVTPKFKQEGLESLRAIIRKGDFMTKGDIKHGFHHIKMIEKASLYLGFKHRGKTYKYLVMPMGNSSSPYIFHMMVKLALKYIKEILKIRIAWYVDDFLICSRSKEEAKKNAEAMLTVLTQLSWKINWGKSDFVSKQQKMFLGFIINTTEEPTLKVPYQKKRLIKREVKRLLGSALKGERVKVKRIARVARLCQTISKAMTLTLIYIRELLKYILNKMLEQQWNNEAVHISPKAIKDLVQWLEILHYWNGQSIITTLSDIVIDTDSSNFGWGV